jgi:hypothetical protein
MKARRKFLALVTGFACPAISGCNFLEPKTTIVISNTTANEVQVTVRLINEETNNIVFNYDSAIDPNSDEEHEVTLSGKRNSFRVEVGADHLSDSTNKSDIKSSVSDIGIGITEEDISIEFGVK